MPAVFVCNALPLGHRRSLRSGRTLFPSKQYFSLFPFLLFTIIRCCVVFSSSFLFPSMGDPLSRSLLILTRFAPFFPRFTSSPDIGVLILCRFRIRFPFPFVVRVADGYAHCRILRFNWADASPFSLPFRINVRQSLLFASR